MSYVPSEEDLGQYESESPSFGSKYKDYLQGSLTQMLQSGANAGRHLGMLPSYGYEAITGKEGYSLPKADLSEFIPQSESGQIGKHVGETASDIASLMIPGRAITRGAQALIRYHPLTRGQMGGQIQGPINAAEEAGLTHPLSYRQLQELHDLLSHPALEARGAAGRAITEAGRNAVLNGAAEGNFSALHSGVSLLGDLERAVPKLGESYLARTRIRPLKEQILEGMQNRMRQGGLEDEAENLQQGRQAARRYYETRRRLKKITKPLSVAALIKSGISAVKNLP